eukprot:scaffold316544_cov15-Tisochrysis_lutea.AAC.1
MHHRWACAGELRRPPKKWQLISKSWTPCKASEGATRQVCVCMCMFEVKKVGSSEIGGGRERER